MSTQSIRRTRQLLSEEVLYPSSDGKPMAETPIHRDLMSYFIAALTIFFREQPSVVVSGNDFLYYEQGNPKACVSPDVYVVLGRPRGRRDSYMVWREEGVLPAVVFEFTSRATRDEDALGKRALYEQTLRVPEYFLFDPRAEYLRPRLQGFRLAEGYQALIPVAGRLHSEQLNLDLVEQGEELRLFDPATGRYLPTAEEMADIAEEEKRLKEQERRLREQTLQRAEQEQRLRERAEAAAAQEARRAEQAEADVARLRAELEKARESGQP